MLFLDSYHSILPNGTFKPLNCNNKRKPAQKNKCPDVQNT